MPFELISNSTSGLSITFSSSNPNVVTIDGSAATIVSAGIITITAMQQGNDEYLAANNVEQELVVNKAAQTITFNTLDAKIYGDAKFTLEATSDSGLPAGYESSNPNVATIQNGEVTIVGAGSTIITASQAGNDNYAAATPVQQELVVNLMGQQVNVTPTMTKIFGDPDFSLPPSSNTGMPLTYSSADPTVASISGSTVAIHHSGVIGIAYNQPGDANHLAISGTINLTIDKATQQIDFAPITTGQLAGEEVDLTATATSGLPVEYSSSDDAVAQVIGSKLMLVGSGTTTVIATQSGNSDYHSATAAQDYTVTLILGLNGELENLILFPNPVKNKLTLRSNKELGLIKMVWIYDAEGKLLLKEEYSSGKEETELNMEKFISGTYTVIINQRIGYKVIKE
jgi:hypothetical protein